MLGAAVHIRIQQNQTVAAYARTPGSNLDITQVCLDSYTDRLTLFICNGLQRQVTNI
jgi:hypothetical protein